jgi:hypothetical protein
VVPIFIGQYALSAIPIFIPVVRLLVIPRIIRAFSTWVAQRFSVAIRLPTIQEALAAEVNLPRCPIVARVFKGIHHSFFESHPFQMSLPEASLQYFEDLNT